jgi:hypothetical protein
MAPTFLRFASPVILAWGLVAHGSAQSAPPAAAKTSNVKYKVNVPPSADLSYSIRAKQKGMRVDGDAVVHWSTSDNRFEVKSETRATLLGKILETRSEGGIDEYGLAPTTYTEKRFRKDPITTSFDRAAKTIRFGKSSEGYALKGGEQDRSSALWQLVSIARAAPAKFKPGSEWSFVVAGHRDAEPWTFRVLKQEKMKTASGETNAIQVSRTPSADSKDQALDIWLAPSLEWYPVRVRFTESDGDYIEQTLQEAKKKSS